MLTCRSPLSRAGVQTLCSRNPKLLGRMPLVCDLIFTNAHHKDSLPLDAANNSSLTYNLPKQVTCSDKVQRVIFRSLSKRINCDANTSTDRLRFAIRFKLKANENTHCHPLLATVCARVLRDQWPAYLDDVRRKFRI